MGIRFLTMVTIGVTWILAHGVSGQQLPILDNPLSRLPAIQNQQKSNEKPVPAKGPLSAEIREIHEIRSLLGGGVGQQLEDLFRGDRKQWKLEAEAEFQDELLRLARKVVQGPRKDETKVRSQVIQPLPYARPQSPKANMVSAVNWMRVPSSVRVPSLAQAEKLRAAACSLEGIAAEMEDAELYEAADQIRDNAHQIWMQARRGGRENRFGRK